MVRHRTQKTMAGELIALFVVVAALVGIAIREARRERRDAKFLSYRSMMIFQ